MVLPAWQRQSLTLSHRAADESGPVRERSKRQQQPARRPCFVLSGVLDRCFVAADLRYAKQPRTPMSDRDVALSRVSG